MNRRCHAFTLIELLVVIAVIAVLAAVLLPVIQDALISGQSTTAINKLGEFSKGVSSYGASNNDYMPLPAGASGAYNPGFGQAGEDLAWYNDLAAFLSTKPLAEMTSGPQKQAFFKSSSLFYLPAAKYTANKSKPQFCFGMNAELANWSNPGKEKRVKVTSLPYPSKTVMFAEGGIAGEQTSPAYVKLGYTKKPAYGAFCAVAAKDFVARYKKIGLIAFGDNSVRRTELDDVVNTGFSQKIGEVGWKVDGSDVQ
jgi:prepilin-type N-terminal cleavage/methylation domain-containing protein